jgi:hypothetical protein
MKKTLKKVSYNPDGYGLILPEIKTRLQGAEHVLGSDLELNWPIVQPSGSWIGDLPEFQLQRKNNTETNACTVFGTNAAYGAAEHRLSGKKTDWSERYGANIAKSKGILDPTIGADPHRIAEMYRNESGLLPEEDAPWTDDVDSSAEYYSLSVNALIPKAVQVYKTRRLHHKWLWDTPITPQEKRARIQAALPKGPVCASVAAWHYKNGLYYKPAGSGDNHWQMIAEAEGTKPYKDFDSYPDTFDGDAIKLLDPYYDFALAKVYRIEEVFTLFVKNLAFQMTDPEIERLQRALLSLGYKLPNAVTPYYGKETRNAVWLFQLAKQINDDGSHFGPQTRAAFNVALNPKDSFGNLVTIIRSHLGV